MEDGRPQPYFTLHAIPAVAFLLTGAFGGVLWREIANAALSLF